MIIKCEKCGSTMIDKTEGPYIHLVCPNCNYAIATYDYSRDDPMLFDKTIYKLSSKDNKASNENIKVISKINGLNYIKSKEIIQNNDVICEMKAVDLLPIINVLKENKINYKIDPHFEYDN